MANPTLRTSRRFNTQTRLTSRAHTSFLIRPFATYGKTLTFPLSWCILRLNQVWILDLQYDHSETEGTIFHEMDMKIEAITSMTGMSGIFKPHAADIYTVLSVRLLS